MNIHPAFEKYKLSGILPVFVIATLLLFASCSTSRNTAGEDDKTPPGAIKEQESVLKNIESISAEPEEHGEKTEPGHREIDVDSLLAEMSLREKIGQLFFVRVYGNYKSNDDEAYNKLLTQIKKHNIGGLTFFQGDIYGQTVLTNKLQRASQIPLWITQDMEYGAAMRVEGATRFPPAMGVAATQNPNYAYWVGKVTGQEAKALGVNQVFAPVLDVNNNPDNPVINVRSFSADPDTVSQYGKQFIDGLQSQGVLATAKHFPGHGNTDTDSHLSLPVVNKDFSAIDTVELVPFRSAISDSLNSMMSAHIAFPKISVDSTLPATMDPSVLNRILTDSLKFNGMVVTDGLDMHGISSNFSPGEAVVKSLKAGSDLMLLSPDQLTAIHEIEQSIERGIITEARIDSSVRKLLSWKKKKGLFENNQVYIDSLSSRINKREHELIAGEISQKSLTLIKNKDEILPITASKYPNVMVVSVSDGSAGDAGSSLVSQMKAYHPNISSHVLDKRTGKEEKEAMLKDAREADLIVIGSFIYVRSGQEVQFRKEHQTFLKKLYKDTPSALIAFGNPYVVQDIPETNAQLMAWSADYQQVKSTVPALFGGAKVSGRLPIEIPGMYPLGHGITLPQTTLRYDDPEVVGLSRDSLRKVEEIMHEAAFDSTFPGGVVAVVKDGVIAYQQGFGYQTYKKLHPVKDDAVYDLASLTKVTATTPAIMKLVSDNKISLNDKVGKYFDEFREGEKSKITIRNLLLHNSGLPPFRVYIDSLKSEKQIISAVKKEPLIYKPGSEYQYSDLGFILLGEIIEEATGQSLDQYLQDTFYGPLGMNETMFNPSKKGSYFLDRIPPTEQDTVYRHKLMQGEVHDERAYYLNGVAGHAGLFASAGDLAIYSQMLLSKGSYAGNRYLDASVVEQFTQRQSKHVNRGYGFDRKSDGFSTAGSLTSDKTFGHTGFTGTSYWIDPEHDMAIIILTNRVHPYRSYGDKISQIRAQVADAVVSSIIE